MPHLEITEVVLVHHYKHDCGGLNAFVHYKSFGQSLDISTKKIMFEKFFNSAYIHILKFGLRKKILNH